MKNFKMEREIFENNESFQKVYDFVKNKPKEEKRTFPLNMHSIDEEFQKVFHSYISNPQI